MNLNQIHNIYFIGIGGIGMSALARYFMNIGKNVAGYDKTQTHLTSELINLGMDIHFEDNLSLIDEKYLDKTNTLVIITPAVPKEHSEWNFFLKEGFDVKKRAEVLGLITKDTFCFAVAGTHGKTTTSSILGHLLYQSGVDVTAFLGGIVENYNSNIIGDGKTVTVVEADEFDRSFLHLHPNVACITSMDADHLDIYGDSSEIEKSFIEFSQKVTSDSLFIAKHLPLEGNTVGINEEANFQAINIKIENGFYVFDVKSDLEVIENVKFGLPGHHNLSNALIAFAMAKSYGLENNQILSALESFKGVRRRFSFQTRTDNVVYIDDYAHHPTEIDAVHQAVRELYPNKKIIAAFQPHLFSRTRDFIDDFASALSKFDEVLLLDIYPARETPISGVNSEWLFGKITCKSKKQTKKNNLVKDIKNSSAKVVAMLGAGDIGVTIQEVTNQLLKTIENET